MYDRLAAAPANRRPTELGSVLDQRRDAVCAQDRRDVGGSDRGPAHRGYGMTETSPITVGNPMSARRRPARSAPVPVHRARIADRAASPVTAGGEPGDLLLQGPQCSPLGNMPEETAAGLLPGGVDPDGDIAVMGDDGFLSIVAGQGLIIAGGSTSTVRGRDCFGTTRTCRCGGRRPAVRTQPAKKSLPWSSRRRRFGGC